MRYGTRADLSAAAALWRRCFPDGSDFPECFLEALGAEHLLLEEENGILCAMCCLVPVLWEEKIWEEKRGIYLYALCVRPESRGKGICARLLRRAEEEDYDFLCLFPATEALGETYRKYGYTVKMEPTGNGIRCIDRLIPLAERSIEEEFPEKIYEKECKKAEKSAIIKKIGMYGLLNPKTSGITAAEAGILPF